MTASSLPAKIARACRLLEAGAAAPGGAPPSLAALAREVGVSPHHFHRLFKAATGLTPKAYAAARRNEALRRELREGRRATVTEAFHAAGFGSSGRFYEKAGSTLGMAPAVYKKGGEGERLRFAAAPCSLGHVLAAEAGKGICHVALGDSVPALERGLRAAFPNAAEIAEDPKLKKTVAAIVKRIETPGAPAPSLPLDIRGTAFQCRVWKALAEIPAGRTESYAAVAERIGSPGAARAVARACATNALAVVIPCHRVVRGSGEMAGYRWGIERKKKLLAREKAAKP